MSNTSQNPDESTGKVEETPEEAEEVSQETGEAETEKVEEQLPVGEETAAEPEAEEEEEEAEEVEEAEEEEEIQIVEERVYTIPFRKAWATPRGKRAPRVSRMVRDFARRHMKSDNIKISNEVNEELWAGGTKKPPRQIKVRIVKDKEGKVIVYPATAA